MLFILRRLHLTKLVESEKKFKGKANLSKVQAALGLACALRQCQGINGTPLAAIHNKPCGGRSVKANEPLQVFIASQENKPLGQEDSISKELLDCISKLVKATTRTEKSVRTIF